MTSASNRTRAAVAAGGKKVSELAWTVARDQRKEARLQRRWKALELGLGLALTLFSRRVAERLWIVMTGEEPPVLGHAGEPAKDLREAGEESPTAVDA